MGSEMSQLGSDLGQFWGWILVPRGGFEHLSQSGFRELAMMQIFDGPGAGREEAIDHQHGRDQILAADRPHPEQSKPSNYEHKIADPLCCPTDQRHMLELGAWTTETVL